MTKSPLPAASAGLPAIDRRSVVCGLGTAAIAGVPVTAGAAPMSDDPVFQAMAALEQLKIYAIEPDAAHTVAENAVFATRRENVVTLDGKEIRTHEQIDAHFTPAFGPGDEEEFNRIVANIETLRPRHLSDAIALLRFVANLMEGFHGDGEHEHYVAAIRNAAGFFEGRGSA